MSPARVLAEHDSAEITEWMAFFSLQEKGRQERAVRSDLAQAAAGNRRAAKAKANR